ncbi:radical SAM family heme chaperone HemW [Senegalia massiliensis]|uniref:Heme chaperone HemW n=1 Tax=Senegalia massiliensis TaxID=1720316 RepID=A0A845QS85_9CLOT|nr:radical SAM family heme chaperone HemW [Senegalia massiliensis]NBI05667.1 radical SAM family heme chaperone HemW [Senegalia massiliensis]
MKDAALYIHIPFCIKKCDYCDFTSFCYNEKKVEEYISLLLKEIDMYSDIVTEYKFKTLFFGGGTPSLVNEKFIGDILEKLNDKFKLDLEEITIEANPKTLNKNKLLYYKKMGINRISVGVQSFQDRILNDIGRVHNKNDFLSTYNLLKETGFTNINTDIMFNLPDQNIEDVLESLNQMIKLNIPHISFYSLSIEEGTPFYKRYNEGNLNISHEDIERKMYHEGIKVLEKNNIYQYEISNFSKKGYECKHNMYYWKLKPYLGLGVSSHSNMFSKRWGNTKNYLDYKSNIYKNKFPVDYSENIDLETEMSEYIILGLRLNEGISKIKFKERYNIELDKKFKKAIEESIGYGLIENKKDRIYLTKKGRDLSNRVFSLFI